MREDERERENLFGKSGKGDAGSDLGEIRAIEKEERRKRGHEDGTVQPASTSRRSRGWGRRGRRVERG